jgi:Spy/CpxP family protein refolding chaperone
VGIDERLQVFTIGRQHIPEVRVLIGMESIFTMKRKLVNFLATSVFATSLLWAQNPRTPPDPATLAQHRVSRLATVLDLTAAQQQQATTIFTNSGTADAATFTSMKTARQSLNTAVKANDSNGISQAAATIGSLTTQITTTNASAEAAFYQLLTPDQRTKYDQLGSHVGGFGPGAGAGPAGFHGRGGR